jgi:hypothetical protein
MSLSSPSDVQARLEDIEKDLALRQNELETAALDWFKAKRDREKSHAEVFLLDTGTVAERKAKADLATADVGCVQEGKYEGLRSVVRVLETRANIGMSLLRSQGRAA